MNLIQRSEATEVCHLSIDIALGDRAVFASHRGSLACPLTASRAWQEAAGIITGPLFRPVTKGRKVAQSVAEMPARGFFK